MRRLERTRLVILSGSDYAARVIIPWKAGDPIALSMDAEGGCVTYYLEEHVTELGRALVAAAADNEAWPKKGRWDRARDAEVRMGPLKASISVPLSPTDTIYVSIVSRGVVAGYELDNDDANALGSALIAAAAENHADSGEAVSA